MGDIVPTAGRIKGDTEEPCCRRLPPALSLCPPVSLDPCPHRASFVETRLLSPPAVSSPTFPFITHFPHHFHANFSSKQREKPCYVIYSDAAGLSVARGLVPLRQKSHSLELKS